VLQQQRQRQVQQGTEQPQQGSHQRLLHRPLQPPSPRCSPTPPRPTREQGRPPRLLRLLDNALQRAALPLSASAPPQPVAAALAAEARQQHQHPPARQLHAQPQTQAAPVAKQRMASAAAAGTSGGRMRQGERPGQRQGCSPKSAPCAAQQQQRQLPPRLPVGGDQQAAAATPAPEPMDVVRGQAAKQAQQPGPEQQRPQLQQQVPPAPLPRVVPVVPHACAAPIQEEQDIPWEEKCLIFLQDEDPTSALSSGQRMMVVRHAYEQLGCDQWATVPWQRLKGSLLDAALHLFPAIDPDPRPWQLVPPRPRRVQHARRPRAPSSTRSASPGSRTGTTAHTPRSRSRSPPAPRRRSGRPRRPPGEWYKANPAAVARPAANAREGVSP
jgi:hypothetical protein